MELRLKPYSGNRSPLQGILLRGDDVRQWLSDLQKLQLPPDSVTAYIIPDAAGTAITGCLLVLPATIDRRVPGRHTYLQCLHGLLFFPEQAMIFPTVSDRELDNLLVSRRHFFHPESGLTELVRPVDWSELIRLPDASAARAIMPARPAFIPGQVRSFQLQAQSPEEALEQLNRQLAVDRKTFTDEPLTSREKMKLWLLQRFLGGPGNRKTDVRTSSLKKWFSGHTARIDQFFDELLLDVEALEERNKKHLERLLDMCRNNPEEALRYALPLDPHQTGRGLTPGELKLSPQWSWLGDLVASGLSAGGGAIFLSDQSYYTLQQQYRHMAEDLIRKGDHQKAAFVYLKLLKNYQSAAQTLENGKLYKDAAVVWLKLLNNKEKAAFCYEQAAMYQAAIDLYLTLGNQARLGDLYSRLNRFADARRHYELLIQEHIGQRRYLKAADVYADKLQDQTRARATLLEGWKNQTDAFACLSRYIGSIPGARHQYNAMLEIYRQDVTERSFRDYLHVLRTIYGREPAYQDAYTEIAHEIIVTYQEKHNDLISELRFFDSGNSLLLKDILRHKNNHQHNR